MSDKQKCACCGVEMDKNYIGQHYIWEACVKNLKAENHRLHNELAEMTNNRDSEKRWADKYQTDYKSTLVGWDGERQQVERLRKALEELREWHTFLTTEEINEKLDKALRGEE